MTAASGAVVAESVSTADDSTSAPVELPEHDATTRLKAQSSAPRLRTFVLIDTCTTLIAKDDPERLKTKRCRDSQVPSSWPTPKFR